jgi:Tfp pilus assembly protein PilF
MRLYEAEAASSFRRAVELDPEFAAARIMLASVSRLPAERREQMEKLGATNVERLTARERFLVEIAMARGDRPRVEAIAARELAARPDDPWVLFTAAQHAWDRENWSEAERLYRDLLEVDPNWVVAHNHLGYIAMSQAKFSRAEEHFRTYAYVAPDQANPHDSLGELLALTGRYAEARAEIELALAEKPDFCASYVNLLGLALFAGTSEGTEPVLERMRRNCPQPMVEQATCEVATAAAFFDGDYDRPWREGFAGCGEKPGERGALFHRLALLAGRPEVAAEEEKALREALAEPQELGPAKGRRYGVELAHLEGVRALAAGHADEAIARFREADEQASFWAASEGRFKLWNLAHLVVALERENDPEGARRAYAAASAVNPAFAALASERLRDFGPIRR